MTWRSMSSQSEALEQAEVCECAQGFEGPTCENVTIPENVDPSNQCTLECKNGGNCVFEWMQSDASSEVSSLEAYFLSSLMICGKISLVLRNSYACI